MNSEDVPIDWNVPYDEAREEDVDKVRRYRFQNVSPMTLLNVFPKLPISFSSKVYEREKES